jgi:hypothetical protein
MATVRDRQRFELALASSDPATTLHELAKALKAEGMEQVAMYHLFAEYQQKIDGVDPRYEPIVDNMDLIWGGGWAKGRALFETELTSADIAEPGAAADGGA